MVGNTSCTEINLSVTHYCTSQYGKTEVFLGSSGMQIPESMNKDFRHTLHFTKKQKGREIQAHNI